MWDCRNKEDAEFSSSHLPDRWHRLSGTFGGSEHTVCAAAGRSAQWRPASGHLEPGLFADPLAGQSLGDGQAGADRQAAGGH